MSFFEEVFELLDFFRVLVSDVALFADVFAQIIKLQRGVGSLKQVFSNAFPLTHADGLLSAS